MSTAGLYEDGRLAGQDGLSTSGHARVGDHHVNPRLEVLRDAEVVQRGCEEQRVGRDQLVRQRRGERQRGFLLGSTRVLGRVAGEHRGCARRRRDRLHPDVAADDRLGD